MAVVKVLFQAFLKLNYFIEAVKPFHPKGKPQNVSSLSNDYEIYLVLLTNTFLWKSISDFVCENVPWENSENAALDRLPWMCAFCQIIMKFIWQCLSNSDLQSFLKQICISYKNALIQPVGIISNRLEKSSKIHSKFLLSVSVIILAKAIYEWVQYKCFIAIGLKNHLNYISKSYHQHYNIIFSSRLFHFHLQLWNQRNW